MRGWLLALLALLALLVTQTASAHGPIHVAPSRPPQARKSDVMHEVRQVVRRHMPAIRACFERDGMTSSKVDVELTIARTGKATQTRAITTGSPALQRCVGDVFAKMTFARRRAPVRVRYPVHIHVAGQ